MKVHLRAEKNWVQSINDVYFQHMFLYKMKLAILLGIYISLLHEQYSDKIVCILDLLKCAQCHYDF